MNFKTRRITRFHWWVGFLGVFVTAGVIGGILIFWKGLSLTNLSDLVPWGLWITIDLSAIALSAGAFLLSAAVYLLKLKQYQPVARTAVFIGLIGYTMALLTLLLDIGRPDRFWHAMVFWNTHSVLWEVTMCVALYLSVLTMEVLPIFGKAAWFSARWPRLASRFESLHRLTPFLAVAGLALSLLHQSSLGATYGVLLARPIWFRPGLSVLFLISAAAAGPALTVLASMISARFSPEAVVNDSVLEKVSIFVGWVLFGYLYFRFWDMFAMTYSHVPGRDEGLAMLTSGKLAINFWVAEILLGALIPVVILLTPKLRRIPWVRMMALLFVVGGLVAYRWDTNLVGQLVIAANLPQGVTTMYTEYSPSFVEFIVGFGVIAYGILGYTLGVKYLGVVDHSSHEEEPLEQKVPKVMTPSPV